MSLGRLPGCPHPYPFSVGPSAEEERGFDAAGARDTGYWFQRAWVVGLTLGSALSCTREEGERAALVMVLRGSACLRRGRGGLASLTLE